MKNQKKTTNVAHFITSLDAGGSEKMLLKLLKERKDFGYLDIVIVLKGFGAIQKYFQNEGIIVYNLNVNFGVNFFSSFFTVVKILKKYNIGILQSWLYHSDLYVSILSVFVRKKILWNVRCSVTSMKFSTKFILFSLRYLSHIIPSKIIYASKSGMVSHESFGFAKNKGIVISNGFEDIYNNLEEDFIKSNYNIEDKVVIGTIGRYHPDKDYKTLIKAAEKVIKNRSDVIFILIGKGLEENNLELVSILEEYKVKENFLLFGYKNDVKKYYNIFDIFCLPSRSEGFPNVIGEALLYKLPVVATSAGDSELLVSNSGIIVPIEDDNSLAEALIELSNLSKNERLELGENGRSRILTNYGISSISKKYTLLYDQFKN